MMQVARCDHTKNLRERMPDALLHHRETHDLSHEPATGRGIVGTETMTTMNVSLSEEMQAFIEAQMAQNGYASASEYLCSLIRDAQKRSAKQELEAKFREAMDSGPATPMTREDWDELERRVWERHHQKQAQRP